jgi:N-terminal acetyltransferase B complex non-catalytic subunit
VSSLRTTACLRLAKTLGSRDRNWLEFLSVLDATFFGIAELQDEGACDVNETRSKKYIERITETREFLSQLAEDNDNKDRSALLALLELEKRSRSYGLSTG